MFIRIKAKRSIIFINDIISWFHSRLAPKLNEESFCMVTVSVYEALFDWTEIFCKTFLIHLPFDRFDPSRTSDIGGVT